jgi:uncharacterized protein
MLQGATSVTWLTWSLGILLGLPTLAALTLVAGHFYILRQYLHIIVRFFTEKPLFMVPRGEPTPDAEEVTFPTTEGLMLKGCYLHGRSPERRGVILFGVEFGSERWSCVPYCEFLLDNGYDVFAYESRSQGTSDAQPGYEPTHWVTDYEVRDAKAALAYLKTRPDTDPRGYGFFGISKGGSAGIMAAADDPDVRCCVTDGIFATRTTMIGYMLKWVTMVSRSYWLQRILPNSYYGLLADAGLRRVQHEAGCRFPHLEKVIGRLAPRPLLMIHGGDDSYIWPEMAKALFAHAREPKDLWLVDGAKHNQALRVTGDLYRQRVLEFFEAHLANRPEADLNSDPRKPSAKVLGRDGMRQAEPLAEVG